MNEYRPARASYVLLGYEIPNPSATGVAGYTVALVIPVAGLAIAGRYFGAAIWAVAVLGFAHIRNMAVRREISEGLHDPNWGPHFRRLEQWKLDAGVPKWLVQLGRVVNNDDTLVR